MRKTTQVAWAVACATALVAVAGAPAIARLWKPTPLQSAQDYTVLIHNKGADGRVTIQWLAPTTVTAGTVQQLLDKYVLISITRSRPMTGGGVSWDDVLGVQAMDGSGQPLKAVPTDAEPPALIGMTATVDAAARQASQGKAKVYWGIYEAGTVHACAPGKLSVAYDGETYTYDTPLPGCPLQ